jgi:histone H3/H4
MVRVIEHGNNTKGNKRVQTRNDIKKKPEVIKNPNEIKKKSLKTTIGGGVTKTKKPHRFRPGTVALREIRKYMKTTDDLIPELAFQRLVRSIAADLPYNKFLIENSVKNGESVDNEDINLIRFANDAIPALKAAAQDFLIKLFRKSNIASKHAKRETIFPQDMRLWTEGDDRLKLTDFPESIIKPRKRTEKKKKNNGKKEPTTKKDIQNSDINNNSIDINLNCNSSFI